MKRYKAIFFDWDGTAVTSRKEPVDRVAGPMKALLSQGVKLVIISGTTYENIGEGRLAERFSPEERQNLFLGLGRGAYNYGSDEQGRLLDLGGVTANRERMLEVHRVTFELHALLYGTYGINTEIVFQRPNYCKLDLQADNDRGDALFMQAGEAERVNQMLAEKGFDGGLAGLIRLTEKLGRDRGLDLRATTDAKYLEIGFSTKSDNVRRLYSLLKEQSGTEPEECAFWGDEYFEISPGIFGSDSFMLTEMTEAGDFFDVSGVEGVRPPKVNWLGGGVKRFQQFLEEQAALP